MSIHQSAYAGKDEWLTPPYILQALGRFDLDPCAPVNRPWDIAAVHYTIEDQGLNKEWYGRVWLNPPYGRVIGQWMGRMAEHQNGVALVIARTETDWFFSSVWDKATGVLFLRGRLHFYHVNGTRAKGNAGGPSCLVAYSVGDYLALAESGLDGKLVSLST